MTWEGVLSCCCSYAVSAPADRDASQLHYSCRTIIEEGGGGSHGGGREGGGGDQNRFAI